MWDRVAARRRFSIRLTRLKPRAPGFGGPKILVVRTIFSVSVSNYICSFFWFNVRFFAMPLTKNIYRLEQGWAITGPRATCGPPSAGLKPMQPMRLHWAPRLRGPHAMMFGQVVYFYQIIFTR